MKLPGKDAEQLIMTAVEKTAELVNAGSDPTSSVVKVAKDLQLTPGQVNILVHAYNTGATTCQRQHGTDVFEKSADVALADPVAALEQLYPTEIKTAAAIHRETAISFDYAVPASFLAARKVTAEKRAAAATVDLRPSSPAPAKPVDPEYAIKKAESDVRRCRHAIDEARRLKSASFDRMTTRFEDLVQCLRLSGAPPFGWFRKQAGAIYGDAGTLVCDQIVALHPEFAKQADDGKLRSTKIRAFELVDNLLTAIDTFNTKQAEFVHIERVKTAEAEEAIRPFVRPRPDSIFGGPVKVANGAYYSNLAGNYTTRVFDSIANNMTDPSASPEDVNGAVKQLTDPHHESTLRNIRLQSMLTDLMTDDDIVSGYDPEQVSQAFNEINTMAPRLAEQPGAMRTAMAKRLQQGRLSDFEVSQLLGAETQLKRLEVPGGPPSSY